MKLALVVLALVAAAAAAPPSDYAHSEIVRSDYNQQPEGGYNFNFETNQGIVREETGEVKEVLNEENKPVQVVVMRGSYKYVDEEGKPLTITYYADETGYHAEGDSIPKTQ